MKRIILVCLCMLFEQSLSFAATDCKIVHYPDRTEVVCTGDSRLKPVSKDSSAAGENQSNGAGSAPVAQIDGNAPYSTVQEAYDDAVDGDVIKITGATTPGSLLANNRRLSPVTFKGGHDSSFTQIPGATTTILGTVRLRHGRVNMHAIKVGPGGTRDLEPCKPRDSRKFRDPCKSKSLNHEDHRS